MLRRVIQYLSSYTSLGLAIIRAKFPDTKNIIEQTITNMLYPDKFDKLITSLRYYCSPYSSWYSFTITKNSSTRTFVEEITGDYTGTLTGLVASHEPRNHTH